MPTSDDPLVLDPRITLLRYNGKRRSFSLKAPQTAGAPPPKILYFSIADVREILGADQSIRENPVSWEPLDADQHLSRRHIEFALTFNKEPHCPAKFCYRHNGKWVVPPVPIDWTIINLSQIDDGTTTRGTHSASTTQSGASLTSMSYHQTQPPNRSADEANARALAIVLRQQELQLEQLEWSMKHQTTREWHAERRIKQRPTSPYPPPSKSGRSPAKPHRTKKRASTDVSTSSEVSSRLTFTNGLPSTSTSTSTGSSSTSRKGKGRELPTSTTSPTAPTHSASATRPITPSSSTSRPETTVAAITFDDPWTEFMSLNQPPEAQDAVTITSTLGEDLEVNFATLEHNIDEFFRESIEGPSPPVPTSLRPPTSEVIKGLTFKKTSAAPGPEARDPLFDADLIPEVDYENGEDDVDMDAEGSPEPSVIVTL